MLAATELVVWVALGVAIAAFLVGELLVRVRKRREAVGSLDTTWGQGTRTDRSFRRVDRWFQAGFDAGASAAVEADAPSDDPADDDQAGNDQTRNDQTRGDQTVDDQTVDDQTFADLELQGVYEWLDRTLTAIGAQTLYGWLRRPLLDPSAIAARRRRIDDLTAEPATRVALQRVLTASSDRDGWDAAIVLSDPGPPLWGPPWLYKTMAYAFLPTLALGFLGSNIFFLGAGFVLAAANPVLHYVVTQQTAGHLEGLRQVRATVGLARALREALPSAVREQVDAAGLEADLKTATKAITIKSSGQQAGVSPLGGIGKGIAEYVGAFMLTAVREYVHSRDGVHTHRAAITSVLRFVGEVDAALSLAHVRCSVDGLCEAEFDPQLHGVQATALVHPQLIDDGVANDVTLGPGSLLVTGSNMAGKSTFLRTVGVNLLLAQVMGLACAERFVHGRLRVIASMQAHDDLGGSVSLYQAEVIRIRTILREGAADPPCLVLLDEVFRGTNPTDRVAASAAVLIDLAGANVVIAATHDLALVELCSDGFDVGHFTERIDDETAEVVFDYALKPGVSRRTNALALLERLDYPASVVARARSLAGVS